MSPNSFSIKQNSNNLNLHKGKSLGPSKRFSLYKKRDTGGKSINFSGVNISLYDERSTDVQEDYN